MSIDANKKQVVDRDGKKVVRPDPQPIVSATGMESVHIAGFQNFVPARNKSMRGNYNLWAYKTERTIISCWKASFWSRVKFLFHGRIWVETLGNNQPAIALQCKKSIIEKAK